MSEAHAPIRQDDPSEGAGVVSGPGAESDRPNVRLIFVAVVAILSIITAVVVGLIQFFGWSLRAEVQRKQLDPVSSILREVRAEEEAKLNRYQWIDQKQGVVRIPIARARELVLSEYNQPPAQAAPSAPGAALHEPNSAASSAAPRGGDP